MQGTQIPLQTYIPTQGRVLPLESPKQRSGGFQATPDAMTKPEMAEICVCRILCQFSIQLDELLSQPTIDAFIVTVQLFRYQEKYAAQIT